MYFGIEQRGQDTLQFIPWIGMEEYVVAVVIVGGARSAAHRASDTRADTQIPQSLIRAGYLRSRSLPRTTRKASRCAPSPVPPAAAWPQRPLLLPSRWAPLSVPSASADDDLKDRQKQVEKKIDRAHDDVEESSKQLRSGQPTGSRPPGASSSTRVRRSRPPAASWPSPRSATPAAAAELAAGRGRRWPAAEADLAAGEADVADQRDVVGDTIMRLYSEGDPDLMAFASLMESESAQDLSRRAEVSQAMVDKQTRDYDRLQAAEVLLEVHENQVADARDDVAVKRDEAAANLAETAGARGRGGGRQGVGRVARG